MKWTTTQAKGQIYFVEMYNGYYLCADATDPLNRIPFLSDIPCDQQYITGSAFLPEQDKEEWGDTYSMDINPPTSYSGYEDRSKWCTFFTLYALRGGDPCNWASLYYKKYGLGYDCSPNIPAIDANIPSFYQSPGGVSLGTQISTCEEVINVMKSKYGILLVGGGHTSLMFKVKTHKSGDPKKAIGYIFDTSNADWRKQITLKDFDFSNWNFSVK